MKTIKRTGDPENRKYEVENVKLNKTTDELEKEMAERRKNNPEPDSIHPETQINYETPTRESIEKNNEEKLKAFNEERQKKDTDAHEAKELAARMLYSEIINKSSLYNEDQLATELIGIIKNITTRDVITQILEHMACPLLPNPKWDNCGDQEKGRSEFCHGIDFMSCPAFARYVTHEIVEKPKRKKSSKKEK